MDITYIANISDNNKKLKDIFKTKLYLSSILIRDITLSKTYTVNNKKVYTNYLVKPGDKIIVNLPNDTSDFSKKFSLNSLPLDILYEDEYLLIVNKPKNMPSHPSCDNYDNTLSNIVAAYLKKQNINSIHIITRLDKNTTGICIFAKHKYIQELFVRKKELINFKKEYLALVYGVVEKNSDIIEENIKRKDGTIILREVTKSKNDGDYAKTEYYTLERNYKKNYSLLRLILHTGRTHQIRVHMSYIGYPLLGDELYAPNIPDISKYIKRVALHCFKVSFLHPMTNKSVEIISNVPSDMKNLISVKITK